MINSVRANISHLTSPKDIWSKLIETYERKGRVSRIRLLQKFLNAILGHGDSLQTHFDMLKDMSRQLSDMGAPISDDQFLMVIFNNTRQRYSYLIAALETREDDVTPLFAMTRLLDEEESQGRDAMNIKGEAALQTRGAQLEQGTRGRMDVRNEQSRRKNQKVKNRNQMRNQGRPRHTVTEKLPTRLHVMT